MKRIVACLIWLLIAEPSVRAQGFLWAKSIVSTDANGSIWGGQLVKDETGKMYMSNYFTGSADFDPGQGTYILTPVSNYNYYIEKLDTDGNFIWVRQLGVQINGIATDDTGSVYVTGNFSGTADLDPGPGTHYLTASNPTTYILKLDSAGNFSWVKQLSGNGSNFGSEIQVQNGGIYVAGGFSGTVDFDPGNAIHNEMASAGGVDIFILKLDVSGSFLWVYADGTSQNDYINGLGHDATGNCYALTDGPSGKSTLIKTDGNGNNVWTKQWDINIFARRLTIAGNELFLGGAFTAVADFDPGINNLILSPFGLSDGFLLKLDLAGNVTWVKQFGGPGNDGTGHILVDAANYIYVSVGSDDVCDFDPGPQQYNLSATPGAGHTDLFIVQLYNSGTLLKVWQIGNKEQEYLSGMMLDNQQNLLLAGSFWDTMDFDPGPGVYEMYSNQWGLSAFLLKLSSTAEAPFFTGRRTSGSGIS